MVSQHSHSGTTGKYENIGPVVPKWKLLDHYGHGFVRQFS